MALSYRIARTGTTRYRVCVRSTRLSSRALLLALAPLALACKPAPDSANGASKGAPSAAAASLMPQAGVPCGALDCRQYDTLEEAFESVLASRPRVVAVGEAHAQKGSTVPSAAKHFTEQVLPVLAGRASDILVELMNPPTGCGQTTQAVRQKQEVVTRSQAPTDQGEYVAMGERARALGIVPDLLRPTCADLDAVKAAGDDAVDASLAMIARLTLAQATKMLARDTEVGDSDKLVVTYGGAIHNDLAPPKDRASWSFAPALDAYAGGRFVAVDLFVPEFIDESDTWKHRSFYAHYDRARLGKKTTVFREGKTFVIVVPESSNKRDSP
jgi:hypothetical protein